MVKGKVRLAFARVARGIRILVLASLLVSAAVPSARSGQPEQLLVNTFGGTFDQHWRRNVIQPFEKLFNARVLTQNAFEPEVIGKLRANPKKPAFDVVGIDTYAAAQLQNEGLLQRLDPRFIPNLTNQLPFAVGTDFYTKWLAVTQVIVYNPSKVSKVPTSWQDLWDTKEYCGKIALPAGGHTQGILLILTAARLNGGSMANPDPGFAALKKLASCVVLYWKTHDQLAQAFQQGEVVVATWSNDRAQSAMDVGVPMKWIIPREGVHVIETSYGIPKNTQHKALAEKYVNFVLSPNVQAANARDMYLLPTNKNTKLDPNLANKLPFGPKFVKLLIKVDWVKINQVREAWTDRYNREVSGR